MADHPQMTPEPQLYTVSAGGFSATADAFAIHPDHKTIWFLSMIGPQASVKAIAATLMKNPPGQAHLIMGTDATDIVGPIISTTPHYATIGTWTSKSQRLKDNAFHTIVYTKWAEHGSESPTFVILPKEEKDAPALYYQYLDKRTPLPIHHTWQEWLWKRAKLTDEEVQPMMTAGLLAYLCTPDHENLKRDISLAIATNTLPIPDTNKKCIPQDTESSTPWTRELLTNGHRPL